MAAVAARSSRACLHDSACDCLRCTGNEVGVAATRMTGHGANTSHGPEQLGWLAAPGLPSLQRPGAGLDVCLPAGCVAAHAPASLTGAAVFAGKWVHTCLCCDSWVMRSASVGFGGLKQSQNDFYYTISLLQRSRTC